jgi:hypothetical protein
MTDDELIGAVLDRAGVSDDAGDTSAVQTGA